MWNPLELCFHDLIFRWFSTGTLGPKLWEYINHLSLFGFTMFYPIWYLCFNSQQLQDPRSTIRPPRSRRNLHDPKLPKKQRKVRMAWEFVAKSCFFWFFWHWCNQNHFWSGIFFFREKHHDVFQLSIYRFLLYFWCWRVPPLCVNRLRQVSHTAPCDQKTILWYCAYIVSIS